MANSRSKAAPAAAADKPLTAQQKAAATRAAKKAQGGVAAPAVHIEKTGSKTVWVACKLPRGLLIQLCEETVIDRPTFGGAVKPTKMFMRVGDQVRLKGYAVPMGKMPKYPIIGDFGLTEVDRKFWDTWLDQNRGLDLVKNGLVFAHGEQSSTAAYAQEHEKLRCGLEPLQQKDDPRAEKINSPNLTDIEVASDKAAA